MLVYGLLVVIIVEVGTLINKNLQDINVMMKLRMPCISFHSAYLAMEILSLLMNELTCARIDRPENEHIKLIILSFKFIDSE
ncbi:MAG: hypothetical protein ACRDA5_07070, partial [Clostridium sp.]